MIEPHASAGYAAIMLSAIVLGFLLSREPHKQLGLKPRQRWGIGFGAFCGAMIASKLPYVLTHPHGPFCLGAWLDNGKTILGGLVGGYAGVEAAKALLGVKVKTGDSFAAPVAVAVAVGRLSCFVAGCCYGTVTSLPWGMDFGDGRLRHPTQVYEFIFHLTAAAGLAWLKRRGMFRNQLFKLYILSYLAYRFATEFIRPEPRLLGPLTGYQIAALLLILVFAGLWAFDQRLMPAARQGEYHG
jgi:phosphatidylglycerol:prolipoprotein diacylglycerol transferase